MAEAEGGSEESGASGRSELANRAHIFCERDRPRQESVTSHAYARAHRAAASRTPTILPTLVYSSSLASLGSHARSKINSLQGCFPQLQPNTSKQSSPVDRIDETPPPAATRAEPPRSHTHPHGPGSSTGVFACGGNSCAQPTRNDINRSLPSEQHHPPDGALAADDDELLASLDVDGLIAQHQKHGSAASNAPHDLEQHQQLAQQQPPPAGSLPPPGTGLEWMCEHGTPLWQCSLIPMHLERMSQRKEELGDAMAENNVSDAERAEWRHLKQLHSELRELPQKKGRSESMQLLQQQQAPNNGSMKSPMMPFEANRQPYEQQQQQPQSASAPVGIDSGGLPDADNSDNHNHPQQHNELSKSHAMENADAEPTIMHGPDQQPPPFVEAEKVQAQRGVWDKENFPWSQELRRTSREVFGHTRFRGRQLEAINATLSGEDCLLLMPTGGGKSLCYQLPAALPNKRSVTFVISPLVSLIHDQAFHLKRLGIPYGVLGNSNLDSTNEVYNDLFSGNPRMRLVFLTPEKLGQSEKTKKMIQRLHSNGQVAQFVIDEAHCVSQWGHDFRKDYTSLYIFKRDFPDVPVLALTATATQRVVSDMISQLRLKRCLVFWQTFNRPNLRYEVRKKGKDSIDDILNIIWEYGFVNNSRVESGIVYCLSQKDCERVANELNRVSPKIDSDMFEQWKHKFPNGIKALPYHAGLTEEQRSNNQSKWSNDIVSIVCATVAFGMGIDKPDVRFVIHHSMPKSLECYYQESGRAGRDGHMSACVLFYQYNDARKLRNMLRESADKDNAPRDVLATNEASLNSMIAYCENPADCRRQLLLAHFGETSFRREQCKQTCDNCRTVAGTKYVMRDLSHIACGAISAAYEMCGLSQSALEDVLRGSNAKSITEALKQCSAYGCAKGSKKSEVERVLRHLIVHGKLLEETTRQDNQWGTITGILKPESHAISEMKNATLKMQLPFPYGKANGKSAGEGEPNRGARKQNKSRAQQSGEDTGADPAQGEKSKSRASTSGRKIPVGKRRRQKQQQRPQQQQHNEEPEVPMALDNDDDEDSDEDFEADECRKSKRKRLSSDEEEVDREEDDVEILGEAEAQQAGTHKEQHQQQAGARLQGQQVGTTDKRKQKKPELSATSQERLQNLLWEYRDQLRQQEECMAHHIYTNSLLKKVQKRLPQTYDEAMTLCGSSKTTLPGVPTIIAGCVKRVVAEDEGRTELPELPDLPPKAKQADVFDDELLFAVDEAEKRHRQGSIDLTR